MAKVTVDGATLTTKKLNPSNEVTEVSTPIDPHPVTGQSVKDPELRFPSIHNFKEKDVPNWSKYIEDAKEFKNENQWIPELTFKEWFDKQVMEMEVSNIGNTSEFKGNTGNYCYNQSLFAYFAALERDAKYSRASQRWLKKVGWRYKFVNQGATVGLFHINGIGKGASFNTFEDSSLYASDTNDTLTSEQNVSVTVRDANPPDEATITISAPTTPPENT